MKGLTWIVGVSLLVLAQAYGLRLWSGLLYEQNRHEFADAVVDIVGMSTLLGCMGLFALLPLFERLGKS